MFIMHKQWWLCIIHLQKSGSFNFFLSKMLIILCHQHLLIVQRHILSLFLDKHWWMTLNDIGLNDGTLIGYFSGNWLHLKETNLKKKKQNNFTCLCLKNLNNKFFFSENLEFDSGKPQCPCFLNRGECLARFSEVTAVLHLIWWCAKQNTAHMFALN